MAGVSEPNREQAPQDSQSNSANRANPANPASMPEAGGPVGLPSPQGSGPGQAPAQPPVQMASEMSDARRAILERQDRDYQRYVRAYKDYHEHAETYRDWVVGGVRIRARETACQLCSDAGTKIYDADVLPRLPLAGCAGDGDGYCTCTYVVALRRSAATALAPEAAAPPPAPTGGASVLPGLCPSCGAVLASSATACRVCGTPNPVLLAMGLSPERPGAPRPGMSDLPPGRNRWLRTLLGGRSTPQPSVAPTVLDGPPVPPVPEPVNDLRFKGRGPGQHPGWSVPLLRPMQRASYRLTRRWHQKTVTLSADMGIIRVVVFKGRDVVAWGSARPDQETSLSEQNDAQPEDRNMAALLELLDQLKIHRERPAQGLSSYTRKLKKTLDPLGFGRARVVMDLPLYDTLVRHLQLPRVAQSYLEPMVISEVVESIPFSKSEVDIAWHTRRRGPTQSVFAVAVPKERADRQVGLLTGAGVPPLAGFARAEALAFAAGITDGILVHMESSHASVVLVQGNLPRVVHQVMFASGEAGSQERAELLARAVDQVSGYYHTLGAADDSGAWPVVLTGEFAEPLATALQQMCRRRAVAFGPELGWPDEFRPEDYAVNLGLFLAYAARPRDRSRVVRGRWVSLNLLADRHRPRMVPATPVAVFVTLLLLWFHPFNLGAYVQDKLVATSSLSGQIDLLKTRAQQHRANQTKERASQKETQELNHQRQLLLLRLKDLENGMETLLARLDSMSATARPVGLSLTSLIQRGDGFTLVGTASTYEQVLVYAANLRSSGLFSDARVLKVDGKEDLGDPLNSTVSFQVEASVPVAVEEAPARAGK